MEDIIGELQSTWGVPPYPQEYRITIKVAEEREPRSDAPEGDNGKSKSGGGERPDRQRTAKTPTRTDGPRREKAPAAPGTTPAAGPQREKATRKKRRRRRRGGAGGGNTGETGGTPPNGNRDAADEGSGGGAPEG